MSNAHSVIAPILEALRSYLQKLNSDELQDKSLPLEFWKIDDDDLFFEALSYLPLHMPLTNAGEVTGWQHMPEGFKLAFPIFWLEDDYQVNGWTALTNAGEWLLPQAIAAYDRIGMTSEARALAAALQSCSEHPTDDEAAEAAYKSINNPYADEELKFAALLKFFRANSQLFEVE
jgi:hypothetical protein